MPAALSTALVALVAHELTLLALRRVPAPTRTTLLAAPLLGLYPRYETRLPPARTTLLATALLRLPTTLLVVSALLAALLSSTASLLLVLLAALLTLLAGELALLVALLAVRGVAAAATPSLVAALLSSALLSVVLSASVLVLVASCHSCGSAVAWVSNRRCKLNPAAGAVIPPLGPVFAVVAESTPRNTSLPSEIHACKCLPRSQSPRPLRVRISSQ
jgi:hypothetical protein